MLPHGWDLLPGTCAGTSCPMRLLIASPGLLQKQADIYQESAIFQAFEMAKNISIGAGGAKFADKSSLYHYEGQLNLTDQVKIAEVLVGASLRHFNLNSNGTIFADTTGTYWNK